MAKHKPLTGQGGKGSTDRTANKDRFNANFDLLKPSKETPESVRQKLRQCKEAIDEGEDLPRWFF